MRTCNKCGKALPEESFSKSRSDPSGFFRWCKECWNGIRRERYAKNPGPFKRAEERYRRRKMGLTNETCIWCGVPAVKRIPFAIGLSKIVPICGRCASDVVTIGRLDDVGATRVLSSLSDDDLRLLKIMLTGEVLNVKAALEKVVVYEGQR